MSSMQAIADLLTETDFDIQRLFLFSPSGSQFQRFVDSDLSESLIVVAPTNTVDSDSFVEMPIEFTAVRDQIRFGVEGGMQLDFVEQGDTVACALSIFDRPLDSLVHVVVNETMRSGLYSLFTDSRAEANVVRDVFEVAVDLGKKGQKGKPVGALFVVGDAGNVMNKSKALSYNPFEKSYVHVGDPIVTVMLKEFSRLDGAFVISDAGKIVSAYRYLEPAAEGIDIPKGLGARHMAGAAISSETNAISVVLSESDGLVRIFKHGELILQVDPEEY
jgi:Uncharacterized conserved protein